jgi:SCY1-like protein 1
MSPETIKWGLFSIAVQTMILKTLRPVLILIQQTVKFINDDASSIHGSLKAGSIYTSESGEWKLGGFEVLSSLKDDEAIVYVCDVPIIDGPDSEINLLELWKPYARCCAVHTS